MSLPRESRIVKGRKCPEIEGYPIDGLSIGGHETCVIFPSLKVAFDIGRCPEAAISQDHVFISHGHMDHIGGLPIYVAIRGFHNMKPPTIFVPASIKEDVERLFEVYRTLNNFELNHTLIGLHIGEEYHLKEDLTVKAFRTYHVVPSQGYIIYSLRQKLKQQYYGLTGEEIKDMRLSGVEVTVTVASPEIAYTGDTSSSFIFDQNNCDVLKARILVMESTYIDEMMTLEDAKQHGHTHLLEIASCAEKFENKAVLLIHFSSRYSRDEIEAAVSKLPPGLRNKAFALLAGF